MYSHPDPDIDMEGEFWPMMGILATILGLWTALVHLIDYLTFDKIPWWAEPFTIIPLFLVIIMKELYDSLNPLHWWPMFWGYQVKLPDQSRITIRPLDEEAIYKKYGGKFNVFIVDYEQIKFRKKKDAVYFVLTNVIS